MEPYVKTASKQPQNSIFSDNTAIEEMRHFRLKKTFRLVYPPQARPKVLGIDCDVVDISSTGIRFAHNQRCYQCPEFLTINNLVGLKIQFSDGKIVDVQVKILRCFEDVELGKTCFAGSIVRGLSKHRINKEQNHYAVRESTIIDKSAGQAPTCTIPCFS